MGTSGTKVLLLKRRNFMLDWLWLFLPLAFYHGWLTGRSHGVRLGAAGMADFGVGAEARASCLPARARARRMAAPRAVFAEPPNLPPGR